MSGAISVFGLGKLGASMAAALAHRGLGVVGVDVSRRAVDAINSGRAPVEETGLDELVAANRDRLRATLDPREALHASDLSFVIVPTPSDERGAFSTRYAELAFRGIGEALADKQGYHVVVLTSTVLPGSTRHTLLPVLERASGKRCGPDFGLCYNPELIALGTVIRDLLNPDFCLLGEFDSRSGDALEAVRRKVCLNDPVVRRMTLENAEIAKVALNSYVTMKISFANMLADICERVPGGDVDAVTDAIGSDTRIGRKYLTGGLGFAGPCFPRDNVALGFFGEALGADCRLIRENDAYNRALSDGLVARLQAALQGARSVSVLGLAYKPMSHVVEHSPGVFLAGALADAGMRVVAYDPLANESARPALQYRALVADSLDECLEHADAVLVTTDDPAFRTLGPEDFLRGRESVTVIDFWRCLAGRLADHPKIRYFPVGRCTDTERATRALRSVWSEENP